MLNDPHRLAVGPDGSVFVTDQGNARVRVITPDGIIRTLAGNGTAGALGDGGLARAAEISGQGLGVVCSFSDIAEVGVAVGPDSNVYIGDTCNNRVRRVRWLIPGASPSGSTIASEDGSELYIFDGAGRHLRTLDALTGAARYQFAYDAAGRLTSVTDVDGNITTIEHDASGNPMAIVSPLAKTPCWASM